MELNRCIYNAMNDGPKAKKRNTEEMVCIDGKETREDCRDTDFNTVKSVHFTLCQKPWICPLHPLQQTNCRKFMKAWFTIRKDLDEKKGVVRNVDGVDFHNDVFQGICSGQGGANFKRFELRPL